jgi:TetR/AcrR family transcriptional regulator, transcriptional repressor for nem operon
MSKGEATRQRIIAAAAALFNERGFEGSSVSELMKATGLEKGGIYRHFSGKEELAAAAFDYAWVAAMQARLHDLDETPDSVDKLKQFIANFVERQSPVPGGCPLLNTAIEVDDIETPLRDRALQALQGWRTRLQAILAAGVRKREIRKGTDAKAVATLIISSLEGALMISRLEKRREALRSVQKHLDAFLESSIRLRRRA